MGSPCPLDPSCDLRRGDAIGRSVAGFSTSGPACGFRGDVPKVSLQEKKKKRRPATTDGGGWPVEADDDVSAIRITPLGSWRGHATRRSNAFFKKKNRVLMSTDGILALVTLFSRTC